MSLDDKLNFSSGIINIILGICGIIAALFFRSDAVTTPIMLIGVFVFASMFTYGVSKSLRATIDETV